MTRRLKIWYGRSAYERTHAPPPRDQQQFISEGGAGELLFRLKEQTAGIEPAAGEDYSFPFRSLYATMRIS